MPFAPDMLDPLPAEVRAYILEREQHIAMLEQRIDVLEEQFRLAQLKRFAPLSEQHDLQGCLFSEVESSEQTVPDIGNDQPGATDPDDGITPSARSCRPT